MRNRHSSRWRYCGLLCLLAFVISNTGLAQNPPERPNILWHMGTFNTIAPESPSYLSFTEDGEYFAQGYAALQVFKTDWAKDPGIPRGRTVVSYAINFGGNASFTDRDQQNREYVVRATRLAEWVRNAGAYGGGYLRPSKTFAASGASVWQPLRGNSSDRRFNRLFAVGQSNGQVTLILLDYDNPSTMNANRVSAPAHAGRVTTLAYDPASRTLFTGGEDGLIRSWTVGLSDSTPSLTARQTIAAHRAPITGLAYEFGVLISTATFEASIKGWSVSGGNLPTTPTWQASPPLTRADNALSVSPTGHPNFAAVFVYDFSYYNYYGARSSYLFIRRSSGELVAQVVSGDAGSPVYNPSKGIWVLNHSLITSSSIPTAAPITALASSHPVTALLAIGSATVAGYANGELRSHNPNGNSSSLHPNSRVIGLVDVSRGSTRYVLSADVEGRLVISPVPIGAAILSASSGLTSALSLAAGADATSQRIAISGHRDGQAEIRVFRLTWSGSTPSLTLLASFAPPSGDLSQQMIRFAAANSPDLIVLSGNTLSRWNWSASTNSYQNAFTVNLPGSPSAISVTSNRVWVRYQFRTTYFELRDAQTGARLLEHYSHAPSENAPASPFFAHRTDADVLVFADSVTDALEYGPFVVSNAKEIADTDTDNPYLTPRLVFGLRAIVSDLPTAITASGSSYIVGCRDGRVYTVALPNPTMRAFAYDGVRGGYSAYFGLIGDRLLYSVASLLPQPVSYWEPTLRLSLWSASAGVPQWESRICSSTDCGTSVPYPPTTFTRLSPSNTYLYTFETDTGFSRFTVWGNLGGTPSQVYYLEENSSASSPLIFRRWWMIPVDDQRVGFLHAWPVGAPTGGFQFFETRLRFLQWSPTPNAVDVSIPVNDLRLYDRTNYCGSSSAPTCPQWGNAVFRLRWDLNANRRVAALLGEHRPDSGNPNTIRRRVVLLYRTNAASWSNWTTASILDEGVDFPAGVHPTMIRFHPTTPNLLYVGLNNGRLRIYRLDAVGNITNRAAPDELAPTLGNPGAVAAMDIANFVQNGLNYTAIVFGGANGLSVWAGLVCQPGWINEVHFYTMDVGFSPSLQNQIQVQQPNPSQPPLMVYSNQLVMSAAKLDDLPNIPCPADVNRNGIVDDEDILIVLFAFGGEGFNSSDVNCDGIVDDADLLIVLFEFGSSCP
jgi:hypothetical protein